MSDSEGTMNVNAPEGGNYGRPVGGNGNNGGHNGSGGNASSSDGKTLSVFGMPAVAVPVNGVWGITLFDTAAITAEITAAIAALDKALAVAPYAARMAGIFGLLAPSSLGTAKVGINVNSLAMTALPAGKVLSSPASTLPTQAATVQVNRRITDEVVEGRQHLAVSGVKGLPQSVPVVDARPTGKPGVYSAAVVPGLAPMQISVSKAKPSGITSASKAIASEQAKAVPAGFTGSSGTRDAIVRFPAGSNAQPVYVSVTDILSPAELAKRAALEKQRRAEWDATHPLEVAQREFDSAEKDLMQVELDIKNLQNEVASNIKTVEHFRKGTESKASDPLFRQQMVLSYNGSKATLAANEKKLTTALESRKVKEKKKKDAEVKLEDEKKKPRKGVKEYGQNYHQDPETSDIKGLGELEEARARTPKQGGAGKRARWLGDKGRKVYEWDSKKGELEGYRASDGQHIGVFDPATGKRISDPVNNRNIKKYL
ncbi:colicin-like bacteriocin tRNase domain-containing protein [Erwinia sp. MYb535]|uniref:colicin-like bacteriocin tRNase domain-containing protein n=1 Tax=Erwinia sp. MYb535 TaxID=2745309 RepID=UPI0030B1E8CB